MSEALGVERKLEDLVRLKTEGALTEKEFLLLKESLLGGGATQQSLGQFARKPSRDRGTLGRTLVICVGLVSVVLIGLYYYPYSISREIASVMQEEIDRTGLGYTVVDVELSHQNMLQETNSLLAQISTPQGLVTVPLEVTGNIVFGDYDVQFTITDVIGE